MTNPDFTEQSTSRTVMVGDMPVHYHDVGEGEPVVMLHSYGIGTTGWITFHKVLPAFAQRYRCIVMDLPNFGRTGAGGVQRAAAQPPGPNGSGVDGRLGHREAHLVGNSQGGQSAMVLAMKEPDRVDKLVFGACHIRTGGDLYLMGNRPSEGSLITPGDARQSHPRQRPPLPENPHRRQLPGHRRLGRLHSRPLHRQS